MKNFYRLMHIKAKESDITYDNIKDLVFDLAEQAGYHREVVTLKNGKEVIRTKYSKPWDDVLVAKWYCKLEELFCNKLLKIMYLKDYHVQILERTFIIYFNALQLDKVKSNSGVLSGIYACLLNRIGEVMQENPTYERAQRYLTTAGTGVRDSKDRIVCKNYINTNAVSLSTSIGDDGEVLEDILGDPNSEICDLVLDAKHRLGSDELGLRLLDSMVNSDRQVTFGNISKFIKLDESECNPQVLDRLKNAYKIILGTVRDYYPNEDYVTAYSRKLNIKNKKTVESSLKSM